MSQVRVFDFPSSLPLAQESYIKQPTAGTIFHALAQYCNHLQRYRFLRILPLIIKPFVENTDGNTVPSSDTTIYVPFRTTSYTTELFIAVGISALDRDGEILVKVREAPAFVGGNASPATGAVIDPGCYWRQNNGDLIDPVQDGDYVLRGLRWSPNGFRSPPSVDAADPVSESPRVLKALPGTDIELEFTWKKVCLNSVLIAERFVPFVG